MPYAADNQISENPIVGGIEITQEEYSAAVDAIANGYVIRIINNGMQFVHPDDLKTNYWLSATDMRTANTPEEVPADATTTPPPSEYYDLINGEWVFNLELLRQAKIDDLKLEGFLRIQAVIPGIISFEMLELVREFWLSVAPAARSPTIDFQRAIDTYVAGRDALSYLNDPARTETEIESYDPVNDPAWPA